MQPNSKPSFPSNWASNGTYAAGAAIGVANKVAPSSALIADGFRPDAPFSPQIVNYLLQQYGAALNWTAGLPLDGWRKVTTGGVGTNTREVPRNVVLTQTGAGVVETLTENSGVPGSGAYLGTFSFGATATIRQMQSNGKRACALCTDTGAVLLWSTADFLHAAAFNADTQPAIPSTYSPTDIRLISWISPDMSADGCVFVNHKDIYVGVPSGSTLTWTLSQANVFGTHNYHENSAQSSADTDGTYFLAAIPPITGATKIFGGLLGSVAAQQDLPGSVTGDYCAIVAKGSGIFWAVTLNFAVYSIDLTVGTPVWSLLGAPTLTPTLLNTYTFQLQNSPYLNSVVTLGNSIVCIAATADGSGNKISYLIWSDDFTHWNGFRCDCELLNFSGTRLYMQDASTHDTYASPRLTAALPLF